MPDRYTQKHRALQPGEAEKFAEVAKNAAELGERRKPVSSAAFARAREILDPSLLAEMIQDARENGGSDQLVSQAAVDHAVSRALAGTNVPDRVRPIVRATFLAAAEAFGVKGSSYDASDVVHQAIGTLAAQLDADGEITAHNDDDRSTAEILADIPRG